MESQENEMGQHPQKAPGTAFGTEKELGQCKCHHHKGEAQRTEGKPWGEAVLAQISPALIPSSAYTCLR
jgi:hypothetical protein